MDDTKFSELVKKHKNKSDICRELGLPINGHTMRKVGDKIKLLKLDVSHFDKNWKNKLYSKTTLVCPGCGKTFKTVTGGKLARKTCSVSCSNIAFPRGGAIQYSNYRTLCFKTHKKECVVCGENKIVSVHHYDENHKNDSLENLIPLCPTHHQYVHSRYKDEVLPTINKFRSQFLSVA